VSIEIVLHSILKGFSSALSVVTSAAFVTEDNVYTCYGFFEERSVLLTTYIIVVEASNVEKEYLSSED